MPRRAVFVPVVLLALPAVAWAAVSLRATRLNVGAHPAYVRVVVTFGGTDTLHPGEVQLAAAADVFERGRATVAVGHPGIRTRVSSARGSGVRVRVTRGDGALRVSVVSARRRFKALGERVLQDPQRLALDLWRARPPAAGATIRSDGCLSLDTFTVSAGQVRASGRTLRQVFENSLVVEVRQADGRSVGSRAATAAMGRWRRTVPYQVTRPGPGTLEAAVYSARDGSLECLVQVPVALRP